MRSRFLGCRLDSSRQLRSNAGEGRADGCGERIHGSGSAQGNQASYECVFDEILAGLIHPDIRDNLLESFHCARPLDSKHV